MAARGWQQTRNPHGNKQNIVNDNDNDTGGKYENRIRNSKHKTSRERAKDNKPQHDGNKLHEHESGYSARKHTHTHIHTHTHTQTRITHRKRIHTEAKIRTKATKNSEHNNKRKSRKLDQHENLHDKQTRP